MKNDFRDYICHSAEEELYHFGILGMKWGVRRYQNPDGSLTPEGLKRYNENPRFAKKVRKDKKYQEHERSEREKETQRKVEESNKILTKAKTDFKKNFKEHDKVMRDAAKKSGYNVTGDKPYVGNFVTFGDGTVVCIADYYSKDYPGHVVSVEYDPKNRKASYVSLNG